MQKNLGGLIIMIFKINKYPFRLYNLNFSSEDVLGNFFSSRWGTVALWESYGPNFQKDPLYRVPKLEDSPSNKMSFPKEFVHPRRQKNIFRKDQYNITFLILNIRIFFCK